MLSWGHGSVVMESKNDLGKVRVRRLVLSPELRYGYVAATFKKSHPEAAYISTPDGRLPRMATVRGCTALEQQAPPAGMCPLFAES